MAVNPIPEGCNTVSAYMVVPKGKEALEFYANALGAKPGLCMTGPDGNSVMHAEMHIGNSTIMMAEENPQWNLKSPKTLGGTAVSMHLYVEDVDSLFAQAQAAGFEVVAPLMDAFWGDRFGKLRDPYGHEWSMATHTEDVPPDEMEKRQQEFFKSMGA